MYGRVAQWIRCWTSNPKIAGSGPATIVFFRSSLQVEGKSKILIYSIKFELICLRRFSFFLIFISDILNHCKSVIETKSDLVLSKSL